MNDDLSKVLQDRNFVNCNEKWEKDYLLKKGYTEKAIDYCCSQSLNNNPRDIFEDCLKNYDNKELSE